MAVGYVPEGTFSHLSCETTGTTTAVLRAAGTLGNDTVKIAFPGFAIDTMCNAPEVANSTVAGLPIFSVWQVVAPGLMTLA